MIKQKAGIRQIGIGNKLDCFSNYSEIPKSSTVAKKTTVNLELHGQEIL